MMAGIGKGVEFEDLLPVIAGKLGGEGLLKELCNGFQLLMDKEKGVITLESLRRNSALMGLQDLKEDELVSMMREGDLDGDGALTQMEFCVLMFRLSPQLMKDSWFWLEQALHHELNNNNNSSI
ncbi:Calcium-binding protein PBP1 [Spatholobus suberectus]|nr:Calcium-binding protein PBP1 [Spatholobus suberectus]